jgi:hypothetical protein
MKRTITAVLAILFVFTVTNLFSQNAYVKLGGGYGLGLATQEMGDIGVLPAFNATYGSFGEGVNFQLGFGYNVNSNLAFELDGSYTLGKKFDITSGTGVITTNRYYGNSIFIMPAVVVKAPMKDVTPYTRFGMVIGIPSLFNEETQTGTGANTGTRTFKETGGMALGIQGAVGMTFKAGKNLGFFAEIFGIGMNYAPSQIENTTTYTGQNAQPLVTYNETGTYSNTSSKTPRRSLSSFGLNVGLTYTFGN